MKNSLVRENIVYFPEQINLFKIYIDAKSNNDM